MKIASNQLVSSLKRELLPAYWISGDDPLLLQEACDLVRAHTKTLGFDTRRVFYIDTNFNWHDFLGETQSLSLFSENTLIELRLGDKKLPDAGRKALTEYLKQPATDKVILIIGGKLDAASQKTKWFKAIEAYAGFVQIYPLNSNELPNWIALRLKKYELTADKEAIKLLAERGEGNLLALSQDLEKLSLQYPKANIALDQVMSAISDNSHYDIFALVDAALAANAERTLKILSVLKGEGIEPILILWALAREIRLLFNLSKSAEPVSESLLRKNGVWPKRMALIKFALNRGSLKLYEKLLQQCAYVDEMLKGIRLGNSWDALERMSLNLAGIKL
jgi:DNA polymerase-3 subunit delta